MAETTTIEAPMPGVFYRRPDPDKAVFAEVGDDVEPGDKVALIGVMKNFHDVTVDTDGVVTEFHVENEIEVEAGDSLVTIESN